MARTTGGTRRPRRTKPLLTRSDFRTYLAEKAALIAPGDVGALLARSDDARRRAAAHAETHPRLQRQIGLALDLLADHAGGECPQIPYHAVALLAVAILYLLDPMDVIPDCLPDVGVSDDALVVELAFVMGAPGIERYCLSRDLPTDGLFPKPKPQRPGRAKR